MSLSLQNLFKLRIINKNMNPLNSLKKEHEEIERELIEFEAIINSEIINYSNLVHVFRSFCFLWDFHEEKEEEIFRIMKKEKIVVPVYKMTCDHKDLRGHIKKIKDSINSGDDSKVKKTLKNDLKTLIQKVRKHKNYEDEILYTIFPGQLTNEELTEMENILKKFDKAKAKKK